MSSRRTELRLRDIVEDAARIEHFLGKMTTAEFRAEERTLFAVERLLQRITEAAVQIPADESARIGFQPPTEQMRAFGNRLRHEYRDIDPAIVFDIARVEIPALKIEAEGALDRLMGRLEGL